MAGTLEGARKARDTNIRKYGKDFYREMGRKGGKIGRTGGWASEEIGPDGLTGRERAAVMGKKGGQISRRGKSEKNI